MNYDVKSLDQYSNECNLAVNKTKTNWMVVCTTQMDMVHSLGRKQLSLFYRGSILKHIHVTKLLNVYLDNNLSWIDHITKTLSSGYSTLTVSRKTH